MKENEEKNQNSLNVMYINLIVELITKIFWKLN